jgi:methionyl-tRNA formyltransferase
LRIVFLGTPAFAVQSLQALIENGFDVVAVVTAPDKPAGRGMHMHQSPVKEYAVKKGIPVLQPLKLKDPHFISQLASYKADVQIVIAFRMLPEAVWNMPHLGTINLHASLLPDYRGAAPINRAIMNGETHTGVCTFLLKHEIDTGDLIMSQPVEITANMNAGELHDILMHKGADLIIKTLKTIQSGVYTPIPQKQGSDKTAPKIFTADCEIKWDWDGQKIYNHIRGLAPYPGAFYKHNGKIFKVFESAFVPVSDLVKTGEILSDWRDEYKVKCADGYIAIKSIQPEGKKRLPIKDYLRGAKH